ncbi:MAG: hypothetical protein LBR08_13555 [Bacteroidales bacterium]|jgi:hypothetical protein|nr:hypothetical protein [Bacteroidales bacterium]
MNAQEIIDQIPDDTLLSIINKANELTWNFLALKVMLARLKLKLSMMDNDIARQQSCRDLRDLFRKSRNIPNAQKDMQLIAEQFGTPFA